MKIYDIFTGKERDVSSRAKRPIKFDFSRPRRSEFATKEEYHEALKQRATTTSCKCRHPTFRGGVCCYRTCYHDEHNHYAILKHVTDGLANDEFLLGNVEDGIKREPEKYKRLQEVLQVVSEGNVRCHGCEFPVRREDLRYYLNHDGGILIPYEEKKVWLYSHCAKCGYDYSFTHILTQGRWRREEAVKQ